MPPVDEAKEEAERHWQAVAFRGAVERGDLEAVEEQLTAGFNPTYKMTDGSNWSVLMIGAFSGQGTMVEKFTKGGRNPKIDDRDPNGFQAIQLAALRGHSEICQVLLDKKADVNAEDGDGETSLMKAAAEGHVEVVKLLLKANADPDAVDRNDMSAIKKAARWGHIDCLKELLPKVKDDPRQLKHCLLFGRLNGHEAVTTEMQKILEPEKFAEDAEALPDAEGAMAAADGNLTRGG
mmetsp:Transcript_38602/g.72351  ORF Transcript_38602/g.72351 Transcript_38602/m.72351 type:complete len:236 (+) Transcript_38602:269-976(+)